MGPSKGLDSVSSAILISDHFLFFRLFFGVLTQALSMCFSLMYAGITGEQYHILTLRIFEYFLAALIQNHSSLCTEHGSSVGRGKQTMLPQACLL